MFRHELRRLGKSVLVYGLGGVLNRFLTFLLLPVFTAYLSPAEYGVIAMLGVVAIVIIPIFSLGFEAATAPCYFEGNDQERKQATIWTAFVILCASTAVLGAVSIVFPREISQFVFQTSRYHYLVTLTLLSACLSILSQPWGLYLRFEERANIFVALAVVSSLIAIGLSVLMVVALHRGLLGMIEAQLLGGALTLLLYLALAAPRLRFRLDLRLAHELVRLGFPLIPGFVFIFVIHQGNKYVLQWFHGPEAVGVYTIGFSLGLAMQLAVSAFQSAWLPYFMSFVDKKDEARILFSRILIYYVLGFGALSVLFFIAAKPVVMIMTQPAFREAYKVVGFSATAQFLAGMFSVLLPGVYFAKDVKYVTVVEAGAAIIAVGFDLLLIPPFGLLGAAIALALGALAMVALQLAWNFIRRDAYLRTQYQWGRVSVFALIYVIYVVAMLWQRNFRLSAELIVSMGAIVLFLPALYGLLDRSERQVVGIILKRLQPAWPKPL